MSDDDGYFYEDDSDGDGDESSRNSDLDFNTAAELEDTFRQVLPCFLERANLPVLPACGPCRRDHHRTVTKPVPIDVLQPPQAQYVVYSEEQLRERKQRALAEVTSVLSIPDADAVRVLRLFKW